MTEPGAAPARVPSEASAEDRPTRRRRSILASGLSNRLQRLFNIVRYHRPSQFAWRAASRCRMWLLRRTSGGRLAKRPPPAPDLRPSAGVAVWLDRKLCGRRARGARENSRALHEGRFVFHHEELRLPDPIDWRLARGSGVDHLWRFHLHYHEFLLDLLVDFVDTSNTTSRDRAWSIVGQWIAANPLGDPLGLDDAWHPFCISRRLPVWVALWHASPPPPDAAARIVESLFLQALFLASHPERDIGGNHLLENARGLAFAGAFFSGPDADRFLQLSRTILLQELPQQILSHGEHFERSPMYHAQTLDALLDVRDVTAGIDPDLSQRCASAAVRMADFLQAILHPDGGFPLLGDSAFGEAPEPHDLISQAYRSIRPEADPRRCAAVAAGARSFGDYWTWRSGADFLLLDGGPVGPDHLPAHAHSDLSTLEASIGGRRFIVDSGVFTYRDDDMRTLCRETAAHNVLQIDERDQCDTWSRFRMGYRGHPTELVTGSACGFEWARTGHDAFRRAGVPHVGRWVGCRSPGPWLIVDWANGRGRHRMTNRLHLHPDVRVRSVGPTEIALRLGAAEIRLGALGEGRLEVLEGMYCPEFGERMAGKIVCWTNDVELPAACGWWIARAEISGKAVMKQAPGKLGVVEWLGAEGPLTCRDDILYGQPAN